jgi:hypothetical protein
MMHYDYPACPAINEINRLLFRDVERYEFLLDNNIIEKNAILTVDAKSLYYSIITKSNFFN